MFTLRAIEKANSINEPERDINHLSLRFNCLISSPWVYSGNRFFILNFIFLFKLFFFSGNNERNIILWLDHRASKEAEFINRNKPQVLKYVGGTISLEMQTPKLMWLKENLPETWKKAKYFFDLPDFLTWKATGDNSR